MPSSGSFLLRLNPDTLEKLRLIAQKNSRSINKELEYLVNRHIESYEKEHGGIVIPKE